MKGIWVRALLLGVVTLLACGVQLKNQTATDSATEIAPEQIDLAAMRLSADPDGESFHVIGQIQNKSPKLTLTELQLKVSLQDCTDDGECKVIGEQVATVPTNVPAGQSQAFEANAKFKDLPKTKGTLGWHYSVVATKASAS